MIRSCGRFGRLSGEISVPGDKSISHRALILAAMSKGRSVIRSIGLGDDVASTIECLRRLGFEVSETDGDVLVTSGGWSPVSAELDAGNSGTTMRLLMGALAGAEGAFGLTGDRSLSQRPMNRVAEPLRLMGAQIDLTDDHAPVTVGGRRLSGVEYQSPVNSAQVKSAVLLAGLQAEGTTSVLERHLTRDHTERLLEFAGVPVKRWAGGVSVEAGVDRLSAVDLTVPGDISSAAFFIGAACVLEGSEVRVSRVGVNPTRCGFIEVLRRMGASIEIDLEDKDPEPVGRVVVRAQSLSATEISGGVSAEAIDELPLIAVLATQAEGTTYIRDAGELRLKECDRISAIAQGLAALGAAVEELPDGLVIEGPTALRGGAVDSRHDHRIAMSFAVAGLLASEPVEVSGWESTSISYPGFAEDLATLGR